jgi:hypothetical protein
VTIRSGHAHAPFALAVLTLMVPTAAGCRPSPAKALRETAQRAHSWIAGADLAADHWTRGTVPSALLRVALDDARRGLEAERARLGRSAELMKDARVEEAVRSLDEASTAASRMRDAASRAADPAAIEAARRELWEADRRLQSASAR